MAEWGRINPWAGRFYYRAKFLGQKDVTGSKSE